MPWSKCVRAKQIQLCEHSDDLCVHFPPDSGDEPHLRETLRPGHMQKRACDERVVAADVSPLYLFRLIEKE
jgi:hypothetical protein